MLELPPLSLYVHIPWCVRKCPYCDFNSHEAPHTIPETEYVAALCEDFDRELERIGERQIQTLFIGGGTPSLFSAAAFAKLIAHFYSRGALAADAEITLEANPGTVEADKFRDFRSTGINRLSLGIQSFNDTHLKALGRIHDGRQAQAAIEIAKTAGFDNFNLDLMHGLPQQDTEDALADLRKALEFAPTHLSWYQLTIEPNTVFHRRPPQLPTENLLCNIQEAGEQLLRHNAYINYEVSAYSLEGRQSRHNLNYWSFGDYIGIGAGAHGKITDPANACISRTRKLKQPEHYLRSGPNRDAQVSLVEVADRPLEFLMNALRLRQGFAISTFEDRTGVSFSTVGKQVEYLIADGLLQADDELVTTTSKGYRYLNSVLEEFL